MKQLHWSLVVLSLLFVSCVVQAMDADQRLLVAVKNSDIAAVQDAIDDGADVNVVYDDGKTPMIFAAYRGLDLVNVLLAAGARATINVADNQGYTPLWWAVNGCQLDMIHVLLDAGAGETVNIADNDGDTPLALAIFGNKRLDILEVLLNYAEYGVVEDLYNKCLQEYLPNSFVNTLKAWLDERSGEGVLK